MIAELDRLTQVLEPASERSRRYRLSELEAKGNVVLLGEPGIGKSTVLAHAAQHACTDVVTVRQLLNLAQLNIGPKLFIDGLDQARSPDNADDRVDTLARVVRDNDIKRWWLTCRAEDWRGKADLSAFISAEACENVLVVQLLPLEFSEAVAVLHALGRPSPEIFLDRALANGAEGFIETPLTLTLLHKAIETNDAWPLTRFELFERATKRLAAEWNEEHEHVQRTSVPKLLEVGGIVSLLLLTSNAEALWRRSVPPPFGEEERFLSIDECHIEGAALKDLVDSALMRGGADAFAPVHRTIAEFLAARSLASAVTGGTDRAAFPLRRALALIADTEGKAPTELRGVYGWFTVHLKKLGRVEDAKRLLESDPVSSLLYGDVASFDTHARRKLLYALPTIDPFFRAAERGDSALASLAGEDLAEDFRSILEDRGRKDHLALTVLDALAGGKKVRSLSDVLEDIVVDTERPQAIRGRAIEALLNVASSHEQEAIRLFEALSALPPSPDREALRTRLFEILPAKSLEANTVIDILIANVEVATDHEVLSHYCLQQILSKVSRPDVLDTLADRPTHPWPNHDRPYGLDSLLAALFKGAIEATPDIEVVRLVRWLSVVVPDAHGPVEPLVVEAVGQWIECGNDREIALLLGLTALCDGTSMQLINIYRHVTTRAITEGIVSHLLGTAVSACPYQILYPDSTRHYRNSHSVAESRYQAARRYSWCSPPT